MSELYYWTRPKYYTPPRGVESRLPSKLYGVSPASNLMEKMLKASFAESIFDNDEVCEYGETKIFPLSTLKSICIGINRT